MLLLAVRVYGLIHEVPRMVSRILHVDDNERGEDYQSNMILAATVGGAKGDGKQVAEGAAGIGSSDRKAKVRAAQVSQVAKALKALEGRERTGTK
ncbi:MAG: hypothetical protein DI601_06360 [Azospirillum brasilense]|nr:MAG: hypothetical protein DI601_06360 [Azospirillum brasilense]